MLSALASVLSLGLGFVARRVGKGPVIALGAVAFMLLGVLSKFVGHPETWGWGVLVFYVLMGVGRAVYESTNKAPKRSQLRSKFVSINCIYILYSILY